MLNYRAESGGFTYWGTGEPDLALTAYALQFLVDAGDFMPVDQDVVRNAREWLVKQQQSDGSWRTPGSNDNESHATIELTAYVARILARTDAEPSEPLKRALSFLERESQRIEEPYYLASYALAATDAKDAARVKPIMEKLRARAQEEGNTTYWTLDSKTPFNGWGRAGFVETTALVVQALAKQCVSQTAGCEADRKLINRGLLFLLKEKDSYGVWYSTQTTISVLDAMLLLSAYSGPQNATTQQTVDLIVNGNRLQTPQISDRFNNPVPVDISQFLSTGKNRIEIERPRGLQLATVQAVAKYYVPWTEAKNSSKSDLRLQVKFDKTEAKINEEITCSVKVERVGGRRNGMMLAEIGIPPGAEVDRSTLQDATRDSTISQYDVLPDRVVIYLWPSANGVSFNFKFRPRFGLKAKSAPSILYDYYNPDSVVVLPPSLFTVR